MKRTSRILSAMACSLSVLAGAPAAAQETAQAPEWFGKISFGRYHVKYDKKAQKKRQFVEIRFPIRLSDAEGLDPADVSVDLTIYNLTDNLDIVPAPDSPTLTWPTAHSAWKTKEIRLVATYAAPPATPQEQAAGRKHAYYGFCAKLRHRGQVVSCIASSPDLFPAKNGTDGPAPVEGGPTEEAVIFSDFLKNNPK